MIHHIVHILPHDEISTETRNQAPQKHYYVHVYAKGKQVCRALGDINEQRSGDGVNFVRLFHTSLTKDKRKHIIDREKWGPQLVT